MQYDDLTTLSGIELLKMVGDFEYSLIGTVFKNTDNKQTEASAWLELRI